MATDLTARFALLDAISDRVRRSPEQGGAGLPMSPELGFVPVTRAEVTLYYVFTIYDPVISRALGLRHAPKTGQEFMYREAGSPEVVYLGGILISRASDTAEREQAVEFLLKAQHEWASPYLSPVPLPRLTNVLRQALER